MASENQKYEGFAADQLRTTTQEASTDMLADHPNIEMPGELVQNTINNKPTQK